jgi:hypothetical protein
MSVVLVASLAPAPAAFVSAASAGSASSPWLARAFVPGEFSGLLAGPGGLYSVKVGSGDARIVRIDPTTGSVLSQSAPIGHGLLAGPSLVDRQIWVLAGTVESGRPLEVWLSGFALGSLNMKREVHLALGPEGPTSAEAIELVAGPGGKAWAIIGCRLVQVDAAMGQVARSITLASHGNCSFAIGGSWLYVAGPYESGGYQRLEKRSASDGALVAMGTVPAAPETTAATMAVFEGYLWVAAGSPGSNGNLYLYRASSLQLLGSNLSAIEAHPVPGGTRLPFFIGFPSVDVSGGTVSVGGAGNGADAACFDASTTVLESIGVPKPDNVTGDFVVRPQGTFGMGGLSGESIVKVHPPAACQLNP